MVDGKEGITHADRAVAELLYPYREKVFLVVNKMDVKKQRRTSTTFTAWALRGSILYLPSMEEV